MPTGDTSNPDGPGPDGTSSRRSSPLADFLRAESSSAILLAGGAVAALIWANSPWQSSYFSLWSREFGIKAGGLSLSFDVRHWINDGLMTLFFLVAGLEIKRELTKGHLSTLRAAMLPCIAAAGGMLIPALIYLSIAGSVEPRGWAIPVATDIALALGALSVAGRRVPASGRVFLLALAIVDDIGGIIIIAVVYSSGVSPLWFAVACVSVIATLVLQRTPIQSPAPYVALGICLWLALHEAGIHPTIAGVVMGLLTPMTPHRTASKSPDAITIVEWLQHGLHRWTSILVVPLFALANSGITISAEGLSQAVRSPFTWGIFLGLFVGKPIGISIATGLTVRSGKSDMPTGLSRLQMVGVGSAAGIGFTVAMFITELALSDAGDIAQAKIAILAASLLSAAVSVVVLRGVSSPANS